MHMLSVISFAQMMIIIGVQLHFKLFTGVYECIDILHRMLHMHVIVCRAMNDEHIARQVRRFVE